MAVTNRIYHDANYSFICYNHLGNTIIAADYAGYLITMVFHEGYGDMEEEGVSYKQSKDQQEERNKRADRKSQNSRMSGHSNSVQVFNE